MPVIAILNGPNLNLLGRRQPKVYGHHTLVEVEAMCRAAAADLGLSLSFRQSNHEGVLIEWIHEEGAAVDAGRSIGAVVNPGAFTTSVALHDAIVGVELPVVEVHISNIYAREPFRRHSHVSPAARGLVVGFGVHGYVLAIRALRELTLWGGEG